MRKGLDTVVAKVYAILMTTTPETYTAKCYYCDAVLTATDDSTDAELEAVERESCDECHRYYREPSVGMSDTWAEWNGER